MTLLPELVDPADHPGVVARAIADAPVHRTIFAATRTADAHRPSVRALLARRPGRRGRARLTYGAAGTPGLSFCSA